RRRLAEATDLAQAEHDAATRARTHAEALAAEAQERLKAARKAEHDDAVDALKRARLELDRLRVELKKTAVASKDTMARAEQSIDRVAKEMQKHAPVAQGP